MPIILPFKRVARNTLTVPESNVEPNRWGPRTSKCWAAWAVRSGLWFPADDGAQARGGERRRFPKPTSTTSSGWPTPRSR